MSRQMAIDFEKEYGPQGEVLGDEEPEPIPDDGCLPSDQEITEGELLTEDGQALLEPAPIEEEALALIPVPPAAAQREGESLAELELLCQYAESSGMFPGQNFVVLLTKAMLGKALGIPAAAAFNGIHVIRNQPSISAELQRALAHQAGLRVKCLHSDRQRCDLELVEVATGEVLGSASFTAEEAQTAGLLKGDAWTRWRSEMLYARATTRLISRFASHLLYGITTGE